MRKQRMTFQKFASLAFFTILSTAAFSQSTDNTSTAPKKTGRPDIPGTFVVELGVNRAPGAPDAFSMGLWGSRTVNIYYQYDIRILKSRFSLVPGIGLSLERFKFKNNRTLAFSNDSNDSLKLVSGPEAGLPSLTKSQLITNYIDIPLEIKYSSKPEDPARTFKASIGGRIGFMYDGFTKVKYKEDGDLYKFKSKQDWNLNRFRYGVYGKIGIGNFSLFTYYNMSNLFKNGEGPTGTGTGVETIKDFATYTVGFSLSSF
jgi:hypothetical protein